jgi:hypothetical protein
VVVVRRVPRRTLWCRVVSNVRRAGARDNPVDTPYILL